MFKSTKNSLLLRGIIFLAVAIFCLASPKGVLASLAWVLGALLIVAGVITFIIGRKPDGKTDTVHLVIAVLMAVVGLVIIFNHAIISVMLGIFLAFEGVDLLVQAVRYRQASQDHWWWLLLCSLVVLAMGVWAIFLPKAGGAMLGIVFGIGCLVAAAESFLALKGLKQVEAFFSKNLPRSGFADAEVVE